MSGIVSKLDMLGDLLRADVGVLGIDEERDNVPREYGKSAGKLSEKRPGRSKGEAGTLDALLELIDRCGE